ncbi:MAG: hypothetical protein R2695_00625 [Acidimicrobiales bacterium]
MRAITARRFLVALGVTVVIVGAAPAAADPPGPTDYRSEVIELTPPTAAVSLRFIAGDSFLQMEVVPGHVVEVIGYRGEPYLLFDRDGTVSENRWSPTRAANESRFVAPTRLEEVDTTASPVWEPVADGGTYAWHDHRTHWMNSARPPAADPGDQILEGVVPLLVDGTEIDVTVASYWEKGPGSASTVVLAVAGAITAIGVLVSSRRRRSLELFLVGGAATVAGLLAYRAVPGSTGPPRSLWVLPALAVGVAVLELLVARPTAARPALAQVSDIVLGLCGAWLVAWGVSRGDALTAAIIPTTAPLWFDRLVIALAIGAGIGALGRAAFGVVSGFRASPSP